MQYKFTQDRENYEMYASGGVIYSALGPPALPVRLANEIFRRCMAVRAAQGDSTPCILYDPCCGGAYHLTTLAYFNWDSIDRIYASDISEGAVSLATRNLSLLHVSGIEKRIQELTTLHDQYSKQSHAAALMNARTLRQHLLLFLKEHAINTVIFRADATDRQAISASLADEKPDLVIADIPYGWRSSWDSDSLALTSGEDPVYLLLDALLPKLAPKAVVAVASAKATKVEHEGYQRVEKVKVGRRQIVILRRTPTSRDGQA